jgi:hypothetical protein
MNEEMDKNNENQTESTKITNNAINEDLSEIINKCVLEMYQMEWQRTHDIENKATGIVCFVGVIFSLTIGSLGTIIASTDELTRKEVFSSSIFSPIILFMILIFMILSVFCGIMALSVKKWWFLIADKFCNYFNEAQKKNELTKEKIYTTISEKVTEGIIYNRTNNEKIANYLKWSYILFLLSIVLLVFYFMYVVNISI